MGAGRALQAVALAAGVLALAAGPAAARDVQAITRPSADLALGFTRGGRVAEVLVKEDDRVEPGRLLARLDDEAERLQLAQARAAAEDDTRVLAAEAQLKQKRADLKRIQWAHEQGAAPLWDVEHARLDVEIGEMTLAVTRFEHEQEKRRYEELKAVVDRMRLVSPAAGRVEQVSIEAGETAEPMKPVLRVVRIDPLWIEAPVPLAVATRLKAGDTVRVTFQEPESRGTTTAEGTVTRVSAVADAASDTLTVRVEVPNPAARPAGETVRVSVPDASP